MKNWVLLLRGVMPTGKNRVPMAELRDALAAAGLHEVRTWIQSGNVIAKTALGRAALEQLVQEVVAQRIGADLRVMARSHAELMSVLEGCPFARVEPARLYFSFLSAPPSAESLAGFLALDFAPDEVAVVGDTIYTRYATKLSDSRFTNNFFERRLGVAATTRNFNTLSKLVELSAG